MTHLNVAGEVDLESCRRLRDALQDEQRSCHDVLVDLSGVTFLDSSGIQVLVQAVKDAQVNGWNLAFAADLQPPVRRVLEITSVLPLLPVVE